MMAHMRRPGFQNGTMIPPAKPEATFTDKLETLKEMKGGISPSSKVYILKMYMDDALKDGEITQEQYTEMLMPYFGEVGEKVTKQIDDYERENFANGSNEALKKINEAGAQRVTDKVERFKELVKLNKTPNEAKKIVIEEFDIERGKKAGTPKWMTRGKAELTEEGFDFTESKRGPEPTGDAKDKAARKRDQVIGEGKTFEERIKKEKTKTGFGKKFETAHTANIFQAKKLGMDYPVDALAIQATDINQSVAEILNEELEPLYKQQIELRNKLKKNNTSALRKELDELNLKISDTVATGGKQGSKAANVLKPIIVDPQTLKGKILDLGFKTSDEVMTIPGATTKGTKAGDIEDLMARMNIKENVLGRANELPTPEKTKTMNMFKNANMRLKAELLPGLQEIVEGIKNIPDDIAKKRYMTLGLKALGPIGTFIAVDDTLEALKKGKSVAEALEFGLIGTDVIGKTKDVLALSPEGKEARSVVKQQDMREQIEQDFSGLDTDFDTPNVKSEMSRQEAERKYEKAKIARGMKRVAEEKAIADARAVSIEGLKNLITGERFAGQEIPQEFLATGGRAGFADGPDDPSKRKFLKIAGGIASIPFVGKYFKAAAPVAEKTVEIIRRGADGMPDFISDLITKVITFGKKTFTGGRADEIAENYQLDNYVVTKQGNKTTVKKVDDQGEFGYKEHEMEVDYDPESGGYTYNEASVRPDAEGKLKDVEEFIEDVDLEDMRKYTYDD